MFWFSFLLDESGFLKFSVYQSHPLGPLNKWAGSSGSGSQDQTTRPVTVAEEGTEQEVVGTIREAGAWRAGGARVSEATANGQLLCVNRFAKKLPVFECKWTLDLPAEGQGH